MQEKFVRHELIRENTIEQRLYQQLILASAIKGNTLVVAPTALGKTVIAIMLSAYRLSKFRDGKVVMLAPTKPLAVQHANSFKKFLKLPEDKIVVFTGQLSSEKRKKIFGDAKVICATPQVLQNDIIAGGYSLRDVVLLIFDEAHRAVGDYAYVFIAKKYVEQAKNPLILGLTASPGSSEDRILEVCSNLFIENIEIRTESDPDVRPYIKGLEISWIKVELPKELKEIKKHLETCFKEIILDLKSLGFSLSDFTKKELLSLRESIISEIGSNPSEELYKALALISACINVQHALELLETQGLEPLRKYFQKLKASSSKASKILFENDSFYRAYFYSQKYDVEHPKLKKLVEIVKERVNQKKKGIVFVQYRDTARKIVEELSRVAKPVRFVGQANKDEDKGLTQKQQIEILERFRKGYYNVLVATSVAEEGLDIPKVDFVVFYEPIPSEIRSIQRRGRTGRASAGEVIVLVTKNTRDEAFYWSSVYKEKRMKKLLLELRKKLRKKNDILRKEKEERNVQRTISDYKYRVVVDSRELSSSVVKELLKNGVLPKPEKLDVGDYIVSDRVCVERKRIDDFIESIIDKRIFEQASRLKKAYEKPIIIVEGNKHSRDFNPNALRGAIVSLIVDFGIPVIFSDSEEETASIIALLAKREQEEERRKIQIRGEKRIMSTKEMQEFIVASLPYVNTVLARRLLERFKTVERVFTASKEELLEVKGIGVKTANEIRKILTSEYKP